MYKKIALKLLVIFSNYSLLDARSHTNFIIKNFLPCSENVTYINDLSVKIDNVGNKQYANANVTLRVPLDDNLQSDVVIEKLINDRYTHVFSIKEKHSCSAMHRYTGEFIYEMERAAQLIPGMCPIPLGKYHIHNHLLDFDKLSLQTFPLGHLRIMDVVTDRQNKLVTCGIVEIEIL